MPLRHYLVNDRPVKIVATPDGGADCLVFDWTTGSFVADRSYWSRTMPSDDFADVDAIDADRCDAIVAGLRAEVVASIAERLVTAPGQDGETLVDALVATPPFDAERAVWERDGLTVTRPRLVFRSLLDTRLGRPGIEERPGGQIRLVYTAGNGPARCIIAAEPSSSTADDITTIRFAPRSTNGASASHDDPGDRCG